MTLYKRGSKGAVVKQIQKFLHLYPDGIFGVLTEEAVTKYQEENNLKADGIVGPATLLKMGIALTGEHISMQQSRRKIKEIIIHCSATPEGVDYTIDDIRKWHKDRGWSDIGYHFVIYRDGTVMLGRSIALVGAHCLGHNANSVGICYIGGLENKPNIPMGMQKTKDTRTEEQKNSLLSLLMTLKKLYPEAKIYGHHDFDKHRECPCFDAQAEYRRL